MPNMNNKIDLLLISPSNPKATYQGLSNKYSAIEPPTWALLLAQSVRAKSFKVALLDCLAEDLSHEQVQNIICCLWSKCKCRNYFDEWGCIS